MDTDNSHNEAYAAPVSAGSTQRVGAFDRYVLVPVQALIPGLLAGFQVAGLLFFLNPHWRFEFGPLARTMWLYGAILAGALALLQLPFTWARPLRARKLLPWALVLVFLAAGITHWVHASYFALYLPPGINRRLIKAGVWLSLAGLIAFYTALVHSLRERPYSMRSRGLLLALSILSVYVVVERRDAFDPLPPPTPRISVGESVEHPQLLLVGISSATLDVILPLAEQAALPFFSSLIEQGAYARLGTVSPTRHVPLWTSLATGKLPFRHGSVADELYSAGFAEPDEVFRLLPVGIGFQRWGVPGGRLPQSVGASERFESAVALWQMTSRFDVETIVVGWPSASLQVREARGVSDSYFVGTAPLVASDLGQLEASLPDPRSIDGEVAAHVERLQLDSPLAIQAMRGDLERLAALRTLRGVEPNPAVSVLLLPGLEDISRRNYGGFFSVHFEGRQDEDARRASNLLAAYYRFLDTELEALWRSLPDSAILAVVSAYGVRERNFWERLNGLIWTERQEFGRIADAPDGLLALRGTGVRGGRFVSSAQLTDVTPTLLYGIGLPVARDLDGRVLTDFYEPEFLAKQAMNFIPSYETVRVPAERPGA